MELDEMFSVLDALEAAEVPHWVVGGWGVDVLVGRETRAHRDLDLLTDALRHEECLQALNRLGYTVETDWLPIRLEVRASHDRWVDVHPVALDAQGHGVQGDPLALHYDYPPSVFTTSVIAGRTVPCVTVARQLEGHRGYEPRPQDLHDLALLEQLSRPEPRRVRRRGRRA